MSWANPDARPAGDPLSTDHPHDPGRPINPETATFSAWPRAAFHLALGRLRGVRFPSLPLAAGPRQQSPGRGVQSWEGEVLPNGIRLPKKWPPAAGRLGTDPGEETSPRASLPRVVPRGHPHRLGFAGSDRVITPRQESFILAHRNPMCQRGLRRHSLLPACWVRMSFFGAEGNTSVFVNF